MNNQKIFSTFNIVLCHLAMVSWRAVNSLLSGSQYPLVLYSIKSIGERLSFQYKVTSWALLLFRDETY